MARSCRRTGNTRRQCRSAGAEWQMIGCNRGADERCNDAPGELRVPGWGLGKGTWLGVAGFGHLRNISRFEFNCIRGTLRHKPVTKSVFSSKFEIIAGANRRWRPAQRAGRHDGKFYWNWKQRPGSRAGLQGYCTGTGVGTGAGAVTFSFVPTATGASLLAPPFLSSGIFTVRTVPLPSGKSVSALRIR